MADFTVSVRDLAEFCYRSGDIDHRFTPSPTGVQGTEGHQRVFSKRPDSYTSEYAVDYTLDELTTLLDPAHFFRANRQFYIHLEAAKEIHSYFKGRLKLILQPEVDEEVIISSDRTPLFKSWLDQ